LTTIATDTQTRRPLGKAQTETLKRFIAADSAGTQALSVVDLIESDSSQAPYERRLQRVACRRVCRSLVKRGLLREVGTKTSVTGRAMGDLEAWEGRRVPKGYQRQTLAFALTEAGRQVIARVGNPSEINNSLQAGD
jgi:hypothetical protein